MSGRRYAEGTSVSPERSSIEAALTRYAHNITFHPGACWEWTGVIDRNGYGVASLGKTRNGRAHRIIYEAFRGPVPPELDLDHLCHTTLCPGGPTCPHRRCVRPDHLRPATRRENLKRGSSPRAQAHANNTCTRGHAMTAENTYVSPGGQRQCRACRRIREANRPPRPASGFLPAGGDDRG